MLGFADHRACRSEIYDHTGSVRHHAGYLGVWLHPVPKRADAASSGALVGGGVMLMVGVLGGAAFKRKSWALVMSSFSPVWGLPRVDGNRSSAHRSIASQRIGAAIALASGRAKKDDAKPLRPYICGMGFFIFLSCGRFCNRANLLLFKPFQI